MTWTNHLMYLSSKAKRTAAEYQPDADGRATGPL